MSEDLDQFDGAMITRFVGPATLGSNRRMYQISDGEMRYVQINPEQLARFARVASEDEVRSTRKEPEDDDDDRKIVCPICKQPATLVCETSPSSGRALYDKIAWHTVPIEYAFPTTAKVHITCPASEAQIEDDET